MPIQRYDSSGLVKNNVNEKPTELTQPSEPIELREEDVETGTSVLNTGYDDMILRAQHEAISRDLNVGSLYSDRTILDVPSDHIHSWSKPTQPFTRTMTVPIKNEPVLDIAPDQTVLLLSMIYELIDVCSDDISEDDPNSVVKQILYSFPEKFIKKYINSIKDNPNRREYIIFSEYPSKEIQDMVICAAFGYQEGDEGHIEAVRKMIDTGVIKLKPF